MARYVRKEFLSPCADESGSMVIQVETPLTSQITEYMIRDGSPWMRGSMGITDCSRKIELDFDCSSQSSYEKRIAKLDKMVKEVQDMRKQYEEMWENAKRNLEHKKRQLAQEAIDKANAAKERAANYKGPR